MSTNIAKAGVGYTLANILIKGIGFLTLPIFSRVLDTYDFGIYNVFIAYDAILYVVIGLALHSSIKSANWEFPGKIDEYVSSISLVYLGNMAVLIAIALIFGSQISNLLGLDTVVIVSLVIHSLGTALVTLYNNRISLQYSYKKYMIVAACSSLGNVALSLILIFSVFYGQRYLGRILGATVVLGVVGACLLVVFWRRAYPRINLQWWSFGLSYSIPIVFHGLSQVVLAQMSRLMINYMVSTAAAGIYGLAANLQIVLATLTDSISTVWSTWFYEKMEGTRAEDAASSDARARNRRASEACIKKIQHRAEQLILLFAILTVGLLTFTPEIIWILGGDAYMDGAYCAFGMILSGYCVFVYNIVVVGEYYRQKTGYIMWATMAAAAVNAVLNYICISCFGYVSAAYATLAAYVLYVVFHWCISKHLMGFAIVPLRALFGSAVVLSASTVFGLLALNSVLPRVIANLLICVLLATVLVRRSGGVLGVKSLIGK